MTTPHPTHPYWSHLCIFSRHQDGNPNTGGSAALGGKIGGGWGLTVDPRVTIWTALDDSAHDTTLPVCPTHSVTLSPLTIPGPPATRANGALQIVGGSHHFPINSEGDQLNEEERQRYAPESKRLHLEMQRGEVVLVRNISQTAHGPSFAHG